MSDYFQSYVFREKGPNNPGTFGRVKDWLLAENVVEEKVAGNVQENGDCFPGICASSILTKDNSEWRGVIQNAVSFQVGRIIERSTELEFGCCPDCNNDFPVSSEAFSPINDAVKRYSKGGSGLLLCPHCARLEHLLDWEFGHGLAVGVAKVTFWNWPEHEPDLDGRFYELAGMWCTKVWGRPT